MGVNVYSSPDFGIAGAWLAEYLLESLDAGVVLQDGNLIVGSWNDRALELLDVDAEQLLGARSLHPGRRALHSDGTMLANLDEPAASVLRTGEAIHSYTLGIELGPEVRWLQLTCMPVPGPDRTTRAVLTAFIDITAQKNAADLLNGLTERLERQFELSVSGDLVVDRNGHLVAWNPAAAALLGREETELFGLVIDDVCVVDLTRMLSRLDADPQLEYIEGRTAVVLPDGSELPVVARIRTTDWPGHPGATQLEFFELRPAAP